MKTFKVATLSNYVTLGDPFTAILSTLPSIFNLFSKTPLSMNDLNVIFPGSGYWTTALKTYLMQHIAWKDDKLQANLDQKLKAFIQNVYSKSECLEERGAGCFQIKTYPDVYECDACTQKFFNVLEQEKKSGGYSPVGKYPGTLFGGSSLSTYLPWIVGGGILILLLNKKKRGRK